MNKERRNTLKEISDKCTELKDELDNFELQIEDVLSDIYDVMSEEEDAYDSLPESLQDSERGDSMQCAIDSMEVAVSSLNDTQDKVRALHSSINIAIEKLNKAAK